MSKKGGAKGKKGAKNEVVGTVEPEEEVQPLADLNSPVFVAELLALFKTDPAAVSIQIAKALFCYDYKVNAQSALRVDFVFEAIEFSASNALSPEETVVLIQFQSELRAMVVKGEPDKAIQQSLKEHITPKQYGDRFGVMVNLAEMFITGILQHARLYRMVYTLDPEGRSARSDGDDFVFTETAAIPPPLRRAETMESYVQRKALERLEEQSERDTRRRLERERLMREARTQAERNRSAKQQEELASLFEISKDEAKDAVTELNDTMLNMVKASQQSLLERVIALEAKLPPSIPGQ